MFELVKVGPQSYYINSPAKIGVYQVNESDIYLIDSGNDKDAGRKVRQLMERNGWVLRGILNTHSNADHIGGNRYLQQQTGCKIFAPGIEAAFTRAPLLEPSFLYGGYPDKALRHKFLMAEPSNALDVTDPDFPQEVEIIPLPGHFFDMVGYRTPDGTVFLADCLSSQMTLQKYGLTFIYDVASYLATLDTVAAMQAPKFVPAHAEATDDIAPLARLNRDKVQQILQTLLELCSQPVGFDDLLQQVFDRYGLTMSFEQYVLIGSTVRSYLSYLHEQDKLTVQFTGNRLCWQTVQAD